MNKKKKLFDAVTAIDCVHSELGGISDALLLLDDFLEAEGTMTEETFEEWRAINFVKRFPLYLSTFRVICRDLDRVIDELKTESDTLYAAIVVQNGASVIEGDEA